MRTQARKGYLIGGLTILFICSVYGGTLGAERPGRDPLPPPRNEIAKRNLAEMNYQAPQPRFALVIGNENYRSRGWRLSTPINDSDLVADSLKAVGFEVTSLIDARGADIESGINTLRESVSGAGDDAIGFIYFSGHSLSTDETSVLAPVDATLNRPRSVFASAPKVENVVSQIDGAAGAANFVVLDGSRDAPSEEGRRMSGSRALGATVRTLVAGAAEPGSHAPESGNDVSRLAESFARLVLTPTIDSMKLFELVTVDVRKNSAGRQTPGLLARPRDATNFCFAGCAPIFAEVSAPALDKSGKPVEQPVDFVEAPQIVDSPATATAVPQGGALQIIVDVDGPGPYRTISQAIKDVAYGGRIYVRGGVYNESLVIRKSVVLIGEVSENFPVEINAPMNAPCLTVDSNAGEVIVDNFRFFSKINSRSACVVAKSGRFVLSYSDVIGSTVRPAIDLSGGIVHIESSRISGGSEGVFLQQMHRYSSAYIIDNKILQNKIGVDIASGSRGSTVVAGNEIFDNLDAGLKASGYGPIKVFGNTVQMNQGAGIIVDKYSSLAVVRFNEIVKNGGDGIAVPFGGNGVIEGNNIVGNDGKSVFMRGEQTPNVANNYISNNSGDETRRKRRRR